MQDIEVKPSQGAHFFHNITSLGLGYLTLDSRDAIASIDYAWLDAQPAESETEHVRHLRFAEPLEIVVSSRSDIGAIMKPGQRLVVER